MRFNRILVTTDLSDAALAAVDEAIGICRDYGTKELLLVHICPLSGHRYPGVLDEVDEERTHLEALGEKVQGEIGSETTVRSVVKVGKPAEAIARLAEKEEIDCIVIATHGRSGLSRAFMGSVTSDVLSLTPCPVLVVRSKPEKG